MQVRRLIQGTTPLLISIPHMGTFLPPDIKGRMTDAALRLPDTDWHVDKLYWFAVDMGASILMPTHSRYVVDLNRSQDDADLYPGQVKTGLCPLNTFSGEKIYKDGDEPDDIEKINRVAAYWVPYHETLQTELARLKKEFGYAILYDAHSICSRVPLLFDGHLPDLNLGSARGSSCAPDMAEAASKAAAGGDFSSVLNGRFVGGYITRHYGQPQNYPYGFDEKKAVKLQATLKNVLQSLLAWGKQHY